MQWDKVIQNKSERKENFLRDVNKNHILLYLSGSDLCNPSLLVFVYVVLWSSRWLSDYLLDNSNNISLANEFDQKSNKVTTVRCSVAAADRINEK